MKRRRAEALAVPGLSVLAVILCGCAADRVNLVDAGVLILEPHAAGKVQIAWSSAHEERDGFVVTGALTRPDHVGLGVRAHVDVTVLSPDGNVLYSSRTRDICVPPHVTGRGRSLKRFEVRFPQLPPRGSSVRLVCHSDPHDQTL